MMHATQIAKRHMKQRYKRDLHKAWMYPVRFYREIFRWCRYPFRIISFLWRVATGKQRFTWDG